MGLLSGSKLRYKCLMFTMPGPETYFPFSVNVRPLALLPRRAWGYSALLTKHACLPARPRLLGENGWRLHRSYVLPSDFPRRIRLQLATLAKNTARLDTGPSS